MTYDAIYDKERTFLHEVEDKEIEIRLVEMESFSLNLMKFNMNAK